MFYNSHFGMKKWLFGVCFMQFPIIKKIRIFGTVVIPLVCAYKCFFYFGISTHPGWYFLNPFDIPGLLNRGHYPGSPYRYIFFGGGVRYGTSSPRLFRQTVLKGVFIGDWPLWMYIDYYWQKFIWDKGIYLLDLIQSTFCWRFT